MQILTYSTQVLYMKDLMLSPVDFFSEGVLCAGHKQKATKVVSLVKKAENLSRALKVCITVLKLYFQRYNVKTLPVFIIEYAPTVVTMHWDRQAWANGVDPEQTLQNMASDQVFTICHW